MSEPPRPPPLRQQGYPSQTFTRGTVPYSMQQMPPQQPPPLTLGSFLTRPLPASSSAPHPATARSTPTIVTSISSYQHNVLKDVCTISDNRKGKKKIGCNDDQDVESKKRKLVGGGQSLAAADDGKEKKKRRKRRQPRTADSSVEAPIVGHSGEGLLSSIADEDSGQQRSSDARKKKKREKDSDKPSSAAIASSSTTTWAGALGASVANGPLSSGTAFATASDRAGGVSSLGLVPTKSVARVPGAPFSVKRVERECDSRSIVLYRNFAWSCSVGVVLKCMRNLEAIVVCEFELKVPNMSLYTKIDTLVGKGISSVVVGRLKNLNFVRNKVAHPTGFFELNPAECVDFFNEYVILMEALEAYKGGRFTAFPYWRPVDRPTVETPPQLLENLEKENEALKRNLVNEKKMAHRQAADLRSKNKALEVEKEAALRDAVGLRAQLEAIHRGKAEEKDVEEESKNMDVIESRSSPVPTAPSKSRTVAIGTVVRVVKESSDHFNSVGPITKVTKCYVWLSIPGKGEPRFRKTSVSVTAAA